MAKLAELQGWREELFANLASGVLRATYNGRTTEFRSVADMQRTLALLDQQIAGLAGNTKPVRVVYSRGAKQL
jgi:hypothetical protein